MEIRRKYPESEAELLFFFYSWLVAAIQHALLCSANAARQVITVGLVVNAVSDRTVRTKIYLQQLNRKVVMLYI